MGKLVGSIFVMVMLTACGETLQVPKPRTYPRVIFPEKTYNTFSEGYCDFSFDYPQYSQVIRDTLFFGEKPANDCWLDIEFPDFNGYLHCTYYPLVERGDLDKLIKDEFKMSDKHLARADYIDELPIDKGNGTSGMIFEIEGSVASNLQFYLTDSENHFLRGALYFKTKARPDSIAPVYDFIKEDVSRMIASLEWK